MVQRKKSQPELDEVQEAQHLKKDDRLEQVINKGLVNHSNPPMADLLKAQRRISQNIQEAKALKDIRESTQDSDFED